MHRYLSLIIVLTVLAGAVRAESLVTVIGGGWSVTADGNQSLLSISHETLGTVMEDVRLNLQGERGLRPLKKWSVEKKGENQLSIRTGQPSYRLGSSSWAPEDLEVLQYIGGRMRCSPHKRRPPRTVSWPVCWIHRECR